MNSTEGPPLHQLLTRRLLFVGGKGGVGKTTTAAALALVAAERDRRCLLVSTDPAHSLADLFGRPIGHRDTALAASLWALEIDPDRQADEHLKTVKARMRRLVHPRSFAEIDRQLDLARQAPGTMEAAMLERVAEVMAFAGDKYDQVIFDTAPTGHTVRLLSLPEVMAAWTDGLLGHRQRSARLGSALRHLGSGRVKGDDLSLMDAASDHDEGSRDAQLNELLQTRRRKFVRARQLLLDADVSAFLLVLNPDRPVRPGIGQGPRRPDPVLGAGHRAGRQPGPAQRRRWHVPRCSSAAGNTLSGADRPGLQPAAAGAGTPATGRSSRHGDATPTRTDHRG